MEVRNDVRSENRSEWERSSCLVPDLLSASGGACHSSSRFSPPPVVVVVPSSPAESSSIGKNSDDDDDEEDDADSEVIKSPFNCSFNSNMDALEEALPMRRGISRFYSGKSRSFACLAETSSTSSIKNIVKPDNAYSRKRRNLLAHTLLTENNRTKTSHLIRGQIGGGISKKYASSSTSNLSKLALATAITTSGSEELKDLKLNSDLNVAVLSGPSSPLSPSGSYYRSGSGSGGGGGGDGGLSPSSPLCWRSYSLADLQECGDGGGSSSGS